MQDSKLYLVKPNIVIELQESAHIGAFYSAFVIGSTFSFR